MSGIFNLDAPIWVFMNEVADIIILSLLWWIGCLGIVTVGASTTAAYYVLGKKIRKETTYVARDFFKSFRENFRQSVPLSFLTIIGYGSFYLYISMIIQCVMVPENASYLKFLLPVTLLFSFELFNFNAYAWSLLSRFNVGSKALLKTSFLMLHRHLLTTIVNMGVIAVVCFLIYRCPVVIIAAPGMIMGGQSIMLQKVFSTYINITSEENH